MHMKGSLGAHIKNNYRELSSIFERIVLAMKVSGVPRRRRRQAHCTPDMKEKSCCLYDLIVDFEVLFDGSGFEKSRL